MVRKPCNDGGMEKENPSKSMVLHEGQMGGK